MKVFQTTRRKGQSRGSRDTVREARRRRGRERETGRLGGLRGARSHGGEIDFFRDAKDLDDCLKYFWG